MWIATWNPCAKRCWQRSATENEFKYDHTTQTYQFYKLQQIRKSTSQPKINVIIGENGTGKTHLLKAAYGLCTGSTLHKNKPNISQDELEAALTTKMLRLFMPLDDKLGKMHRQGSTEKAQLHVDFALGQKLSVTFFNNSKSLVIQDSANYDKFQAEPVFIPTKEVLSFMKGFTSLFDKYGLSFDQTYRDVCGFLDLPEVRSETLNEKSKWAMTEIEGICGGRFIFYGGGKVTFKTDNAEYSANAMAEGFRKAGMLSRLLETGVIQPGVSGPLFWDEPESNMNPKLMKLLVQILLRTIAQWATDHPWQPMTMSCSSGSIC